MSGNWTQALKKVIESVYSYFKYDVSTYIASRLDSLGEEDSSSATVVECPRSSVEALRTETQQSGKSEDSRAGSLQDQQTSTDKSHHMKQQPTKLVSSFTVENILMGTQSYSGSPSSTDLESPGGVEACSYSNPVIQPPVKYTRFTMVTPSSMAADKRKKHAEAQLSGRAMAEKVRGKQLGEQDKCFKTEHCGETPLADVQEYSVHCKSKCTPSSSDMSHADSPATSPGVNLMYSVIQSTGSSDRPQFPVPEVSLASRKNFLPQSPLPQQFVVFFPANSASLTAGMQTVVYASPQAVPLKQPLSPPTTSCDLSSVHSPMQSPSTTTTLANTLPPICVAPSMTHIDKTATASTSSEASFIPIAPKTEEIRHRMALRDSENMKLFRKRTIIKPRAPKPPKLPKPRKLHFHMTTVVKRAKRKLSGGLVSMSVPPPSLTCQHKRSLHERSTDGRDSKSPNLETIDNNPSGIITSSSDSHKVDEPSLVITGANTPGSAAQLAVHPQTAVLKDSGYHLQLVKQSISHPAATYRRGVRGCGKRTYTRRKRELTFHLYEDPTTNFRVKRTCKDSKIRN